MIVKGRITKITKKTFNTKKGEVIATVLVLKSKYDSFVINVYGDTMNLKEGDDVSIGCTVKAIVGDKYMFNDISCKSESIRVTTNGYDRAYNEPKDFVDPLEDDVF